MNHDPVMLALDFESAREADKLLAITVLTSFDQDHVRELGSECAVGSPFKGRAMRAELPGFLEAVR